MSLTPSLEWSAEFLVGIPEIDDQHTRIFDQILSLRAACEAGRGKDEINGLIGFLRTYVLEHFHDEEAYQESIGFPEFIEHKRMHSEFTRMFERFVADVAAAGPTEKLVAEINRYMLNWLAVHVAVEDQKYVDFARN